MGDIQNEGSTEQSEIIPSPRIPTGLYISDAERGFLNVDRTNVYGFPTSKLHLTCAKCRSNEHGIVNIVPWTAAQGYTERKAELDIRQSTQTSTRTDKRTPVDECQLLRLKPTRVGYGIEKSMQLPYINL